MSGDNTFGREIHQMVLWGASNSFRIARETYLDRYGYNTSNYKNLQLQESLMAMTSAVPIAVLQEFS
jgi:hypothetical protein